MKTIRRLMIPVGVLLIFFTLAAARANAQGLSSTHFRGTFTLPFEVQWGEMALPAGEYTLSYGFLSPAGSSLVAVAGIMEGNPRGWIIPVPGGNTKATENYLVIVRNGDSGYVRALELAAIGESVQFKMPHGVKVETKIMPGKASLKTNNQLAETRIPVKPAPAK